MTCSHSVLLNENEKKEEEEKTPLPLNSKNKIVEMCEKKCTPLSRLHLKQCTDEQTNKETDRQTNTNGWMGRWEDTLQIAYF